jgi:uncharacterized protein YjbI with pentapeptide repeats
MAAKDQLKIETDAYESEIENTLKKLEIIEFAQDTVKELKRKYEELRDNYYGQRLSFTIDKNAEAEQMATIMAKYSVDLENDILPSIRELHKLASCKQIAIDMLNSRVDTEDVIVILDNYSKLSTDRFSKEKKELREYLISFFYDVIKKECIDNNRYEIIDILYDYKAKGVDFISGVSLLFLKEVDELFKNAEDKSKYIKLVKLATTDEFNKEDIVALLIATGKKTIEVVDKKNTVDFSEAINKFKKIPYTNRKNILGQALVDLGYFMREKNVNPLPKTKEENEALREYDLTTLDYGRSSNNWRKKVKNICPDLNGVDLSYTNAVIVPKYLGSSLRGANLEGVDLRGVDLTGVDITDANLLKTGADIRQAKGKCLGVSAYEDHRTFVSDKTITPMRFKEITDFSVFSALAPPAEKFDNYVPWHNRVLRQYDLSCVDLSFDYIREAYKEMCGGIVQNGKYTDKWKCNGLDFSYTNVNIDPQEFNDTLKLNLEGVDLRDKDFTGKSYYFKDCNLKGTGANIDPKYNHTVSEYIVPTKERKK